MKKWRRDLVPNEQRALEGVDLVMEEREGFGVAVQNGIPVPTFDRQARREIDLSGRWRVQRLRLSADLSLTDRDASLEDILREALPAASVTPSLITRVAAEDSTRPAILACMRADHRAASRHASNRSSHSACAAEPREPT